MQERPSVVLKTTPHKHIVTVLPTLGIHILYNSRKRFRGVVRIKELVLFLKMENYKGLLAQLPWQAPPASQSITQPHLSIQTKPVLIITASIGLSNYNLPKIQQKIEPNMQYYKYNNINTLLLYYSNPNLNKQCPNSSLRLSPTTSQN